MRIDYKYKWLARDDKNNELYAYENKPVKLHWIWDINEGDGSCGRVEETNDMFAFIKWEDKEPTIIEENVETFESIASFGRTLDELSDETKQSQTDVVNKPSHYIGVNGLEVEEVLENFLPKIEDVYIAHRIGSAVEYILRAYSKNKLEDIKKAKRNLEQVIAYEESKVKSEEVVEEPEPTKQPTDDHLSDFLACLRGIKVIEDKNMEKVSTFYHGYNLND